MWLLSTKRNPWLIAGAFAAAYLVVCEVYIWVSDEVARRLAGSLEEMTRIAQIKGTLFVLVTALLIFVAVGWLLRRIARQEQEARRQRESFLLSEQRAMAGVFAATVAHDMKNLLVIFQGEVSMLQGGAAPEPAALANLAAAGQNLRLLAERLMNLGRTAVGTAVESLDLGLECRNLLGLARKHQRASGCTLEVEAAAGLRIPAKAVLLRQALLNLVLNAADATGGQGQVLIRVQPGAGGVCLEVHDNGPGVPEALREKLFAPFYTTKTHGVGLGLLSVKLCAEEHGGTVTVGDSPFLNGACFRLFLPVTPPVPGNPVPMPS